MAETGWPELKKSVGRPPSGGGSANPRLAFRSSAFAVGIGRSSKAMMTLSYVNAFRDFLRRWEEKSETRRIAGIFRVLRLSSWRRADKSRRRSCRAWPMRCSMMTVHAAKGLEFPIVFVLSVASQRFPHRAQKPVIEFPDELRRAPAVPANIHTQEERRLFYVAMTRAKERLYISSVTKPGGKKSIFVERTSIGPRRASALILKSVETPQVREAEKRKDESRPLRPTGAKPAGAQASQPSLFINASDSGRVHPPLARNGPARRPRPPPGWMEKSGSARLPSRSISSAL